MHHVLDGDSTGTDDPGQLGDAARPIAYGHIELNQAAVGGQASLQAAAEDRCINVATTKRNHDSVDATKCVHACKRLHMGMYSLLLALKLWE